MATTIHLNDELLRQVDARAKVLKLSRSKFLTKLIRQGLAADSTWSPDFLQELDALEPIESDELMEGIVENRRSKKAIQW